MPQTARAAHGDALRPSAEWRAGGHSARSSPFQSLAHRSQGDLTMRTNLFALVAPLALALAASCVDDSNQPGVGDTEPTQEEYLGMLR